MKPCQFFLRVEKWMRRKRKTEREGEKEQPRIIMHQTTAMLTSRKPGLVKLIL